MAVSYSLRHASCHSSFNGRSSVAAVSASGRASLSQALWKSGYGIRLSSRTMRSHMCLASSNASLLDDTASTIIRVAVIHCRPYDRQYGTMSPRLLLATIPGAKRACTRAADSPLPSLLPRVPGFAHPAAYATRASCSSTRNTPGNRYQRKPAHLSQSNWSSSAHPASRWSTPMASMSSSAQPWLVSPSLSATLIF